MTQLPATQSNLGESKGLKPSLWAVSGHSIQHLTDILTRKKSEQGTDVLLQPASHKLFLQCPPKATKRKDSVFLS